MHRRHNGVGTSRVVTNLGGRDYEFCQECSRQIEGRIGGNIYLRAKENTTAKIEEMLTRMAPVAEIAQATGINIYTLGRIAKRLGWRQVKVYTKTGAV